MLKKGSLAGRWAASRRCESTGLRRADALAMAPGYYVYCCFLVAIAAAAAHDEPKVGAEERGLVTRLNRRYHGGGLCFKAFIKWPKLGRDRVRECAFQERLAPACKGRLSCSLASKNAPVIFNLEGWGGTVGVVVRPDVTRKCILCSWAWDGWTDLRGCNRSTAV